MVLRRTFPGRRDSAPADALLDGTPSLAQWVALPPEMSNTAPVLKGTPRWPASGQATSPPRYCQAADRDLGQHEVDVLLRHLVEDRFVRTAAGVMQFTRISVFAISLASDLVRSDHPGLGRAVGRSVRVALLPATEAMLTVRP